MEPPPSTETPPTDVPASTEPVVEAKHETDSQLTLPVELAAQSVAPIAADEVPSPQIKDQQSPSSLPPVASSTTTPAEVVNKVSDTVDAPVSPSTLLAAQEAPLEKEELQVAPAPVEKTPEKEEKKMEEVRETEKEEQVTSTNLQPAAEVAAAVTPVNVEKETAAKTTTEVSQPTPPAEEPASSHIQTSAPSTAPEPEPTLADRAEPLLSNGLPQDIGEVSEDRALSDTTPLEKTNTSQSQESTPVTKTTAPAQEEMEEKKEEEEKEKSEDAAPASVSCPPEKSTMQGNNK